MPDSGWERGKAIGRSGQPLTGHDAQDPWIRAGYEHASTYNPYAERNTPSSGGTAQRQNTSTWDYDRVGGGTGQSLTLGEWVAVVCGLLPVWLFVLAFALTLVTEFTEFFMLQRSIILAFDIEAGDVGAPWTWFTIATFFAPYALVFSLVFWIAVGIWCYIRPSQPEA